MTTIDFYTHVEDPLGFAARLCAKAWATHGSVRVLTPDAQATESLDRLLWVAPATAFVPHCRMASPLAAETPVIIDHAPEHEGRCEVLVNLAATPPAFFARFARLAEIAPLDEAGAAAARERFRFYRERGYELRTHPMGGR